MFIRIEAPSRKKEPQFLERKKLLFFLIFTFIDNWGDKNV